MKNFYEGKDILVTGGCGSIGKELVKQILEFSPRRLRVFDQNESGLFHLQEELAAHNNLRFLVGNLRDKERLRRAVRGADIVFHAAALKHVPLCEYNPYEAVQTNVIGTQNLIEVCRDEDVERVIAISTDKAAHPINTMGATKLLSEKLILTGATGKCKTIFSCVRFGNVLNSDGSVIPIFKRQIAKGGPVTITSKEMTRFFMSMGKAIELVLKSAILTRGGEIFILPMNALKITDLAEVIVEELAPKYGYHPEEIEFKEVGIRPGEKTHEYLVTKEEVKDMVHSDDLIVLYSSLLIEPEVRKQLIKKKSTHNHQHYHSGNIPLLSKDEIKKILKKEKII
ncbi:MAG: polysaccharide biosynthesis protein [Candidatus Woesearchaeota archaeon]|nr:MAG: polysaccharide biosynthesis protein [Candidatus Woesearchaeota archaeon]